MDNNENLKLPSDEQFARFMNGDPGREKARFANLLHTTFLMILDRDGSEREKFNRAMDVLFSLYESVECEYDDGDDQHLHRVVLVKIIHDFRRALTGL
jgi:hypothetical protein